MVYLETQVQTLQIRRKLKEVNQALQVSMVLLGQWDQLGSLVPEVKQGLQEHKEL